LHFFWPSFDFVISQGTHVSSFSKLLADLWFCFSFFFFIVVPFPHEICDFFLSLNPPLRAQILGEVAEVGEIVRGPVEA